MKNKFERSPENDKRYMTLEDTRQLFEVMFETRMRKSNFNTPMRMVFIVFDYTTHSIDKVFDNYLSAHKYVETYAFGRAMSITGMEVEQ